MQKSKPKRDANRKLTPPFWLVRGWQLPPVRFSNRLAELFLEGLPVMTLSTEEVERAVLWTSAVLGVLGTDDDVSFPLNGLLPQATHMLRRHTKIERRLGTVYADYTEPNYYFDLLDLGRRTTMLHDGQALAVGAPNAKSKHIQ